MSRPILLFATVIYLVTLHVLAAAFVYSHIVSVDFDREFKKSLHNYYLRRDNSIPDRSFVFLGDSHTHGLCTSCVTKNDVNYGIPSLTSSELLTQIDSYQAISHASTVLLQIGHNDLKQNTNQEIIDNSKRLLAALPKTSKNIVTLQFPVVESIHPRLAGYNERKTFINDELKKICLGHCEVLDLWPFITLNDGKVNARYLAADGIHLSQVGYALWIKNLREKLDAET